MMRYLQRLVALGRGYWATLVARFVVILGGLWLILELVNYFFPNTWGQPIQRWLGGAGFWVMIAVAGAVSLLVTRPTRLQASFDPSTEAVTETCGNQGIDLSHQRLAVSAAFGSYFAGLLEAKNIHTMLPNQVHCYFPDAPKGLNQIEQIMWSMTEPGGARLLVIAADAGMGKSTLAARLTRCLAERSKIERILGDSAKNRRVDVVRGTVIGQTTEIFDSTSCLRKLCAQSGLPYPNGQGANDRAVRLIRDKFLGRRVLIVIDNLESVQDVDELMPRLAAMVSDDLRVIVTTRSTKGLSSFSPRQVLVELQPLRDYSDISKFIRWHVDHFQSSHPRLVNLLPELDNKHNLRRLIDRTGGVPLLVQLVVSKIAVNSWDQLNLLPDCVGDELLRYLYEERWHELVQAGDPGLTARAILAYVTQEQEKGKKVTLRHLGNHLQRSGQERWLSSALDLLHERYLIVNQDPAIGFFVVFPTLAQFVNSKDAGTKPGTGDVSVKPTP